MKFKELRSYYEKFKYGEDSFQNLMQYRVKEILLVSTFYDAYIFEHDSLLSEQIVGEYHQLNLTTVPRITSVPTGKDAIEAIKKKNFDLVITTMRTGEIASFELSSKIKELDQNLPIILLLTAKSDIEIVNRNRDKLNLIENVFIWNGDSKLILAIIKHIEDKKNAPDDTKNGLVRVILLVEDSIIFNSIYLPLLYTEIMEQTQRLISEELNDNQKYNRMRTRPKVLLTSSYEEGLEIYNRYKEHIICVMSDMEFYVNKKLDGNAGVRFLTEIKKNDADLPCILQSSVLANLKKADALGVTFFHKKSQFLLKDLRQFILKNLGFGDLIFRDEKGLELARAKTLSDFEKILPQLPMQVILSHSKNKDFSTWLASHGEAKFAKQVRPIEVEDFNSLEEYINFLVNKFKELKKMRNIGKIVSLNKDSVKQIGVITRIGSGSLGGKGRGLAFFNSFLVTTDFEKKFKDVNIRIPRTTIIGTNEFWKFVEKNNLFDLRNSENDEEIKKMFVSAPLSNYVTEKLQIYLNEIKQPIAVRSSGLLEDSQSQPFAGVYQTYMLPNNNNDANIRLEQLSDAIKLVYASVFLNDTRKYIENLNYIIEEESMAVVIQEIVGNKYEDYHYPHISGVAQSYNYYPVGNIQNQDGVSSIAVGLGQAVVEGEKTFRFCPRYPNVSFVSDEEILKSSQTDFYAIDLNNSEVDLLKGEFGTLAKLRIYKAEKHKNLYHLASVWDKDNNRIVDGIGQAGPRVINFANILKYNIFPLSEILNKVLSMAQLALGIPVEIEFAVDLTKDDYNNIKPTFYLLQVRPMTVNFDETLFDLSKYSDKDFLLYTEEGLGNGIINNVCDLVYVDPEKFDKTQTTEMCLELEKINEHIKNQNREYILIGPGRWGSRDRFLGIPIIWSQISRAKVIVEVGLKNYEIEPSQGTHFFHNVVAMNVGYFNVPFKKKKKSFIDWEYIKSLKSVNKYEYFVHIVNQKPFNVIMDGKKSRSIICK